MDFIEALIAEEKALQAKLAAVRQSLVAYGHNISAAEEPQTAPRPLIRPKDRSAAARIDNFGTYGTTIVNAAFDILPSQAEPPMPTRTLVERMSAHGITVRGGNKVNALSALLARSSRIKGYGRRGWTRADINDAHNENGSPASAPDDPKSVGEDAPPSQPALVLSNPVPGGD